MMPKRNLFRKIQARTLRIARRNLVYNAGHHIIEDGSFPDNPLWIDTLTCLSERGVRIPRLFRKFLKETSHND